MLAGVLVVAPTKLAFYILVSAGSTITTKDDLTCRFTRGEHTLSLAVVAGKRTIFLVEAFTPAPVTRMLGLGPETTITHGADPVPLLKTNLIYHRDIIPGI